MKPTDETNHATRGIPRVSWSQPAAQLRLAGLILTLLCGAVLVIWVTRTSWERVDWLQGQFAGLKAESFYRGVQLRNDVQSLNDLLLQYRLRGEPDVYDKFCLGIGELKRSIENGLTNAFIPLERKFYEHMASAYDAYLVESMAVLQANRTRWQSAQATEFRDSYEKVRKQSQQLLTLCNKFTEDQKVAFAGFLKESDDTLTTFKQLLRLSIVLLLAVVTVLVVMVYRGMIAPLWFRLTESQAIIARQEKLASLGVLAAGVAHEIRNPLTAIKCRLFSLKKSLPGRGSDNEDALVIGNEISRLERIVKDFLQFARPSDPELVEVPLQRILQDVRELLEPQLTKSRIRLNLGPVNELWVRADTQQIKQVLINLIQNAADSIGHEGEITLAARKGGSDSVVLEVTDTGKGVPPEVEKRLFDPFFSTKEGGTGLGLPIAARIVEKHGGELRYESHLNRGTTFAIVLPRFKPNES